MSADPNFKLHRALKPRKRPNHAGRSPHPGATRRTITQTELTTAEGHHAEIAVHLLISADRTRAEVVTSPRCWIGGQPHPWQAPPDAVAAAVEAALEWLPMRPEVVPSLKMLR